MGQIKNIKLHIVTDIKMGPKKQADTKKAPSQKPKPSGGSKQKKKKWSKGKTRDKLNKESPIAETKTIWRQQTEEEEVVQGKDSGQVEQRKPHRRNQNHLEAANRRRRSGPRERLGTS